MESGDDLDVDTREWVQAEADRHHGGDWVKAASAILRAAHAAELAPENRWAYLEARQQRRAD